MRRFTIFTFLACIAMAACTPTPGTERVTAGESVDIASAGAQLSVQRAQNGLVRPLGYSPALAGGGGKPRAISQPDREFQP
jgi:hypothetical protein